MLYENEKKSNIEYKEIYNHIVNTLNNYNTFIKKSLKFDIEIISKDAIMKGMKVLDDVMSKLNEQIKSLSEQLVKLEEEKVKVEVTQKEIKEAMEQLEVKSKVEKEKIESELATKQHQVFFYLINSLNCLQKNINSTTLHY
jgi:predicted  nucleic acid-binding Zn-ribbon protein